MNDFKKILVLLKSNTVGNVRNCLAECQYYRENITQNILEQTNKQQLSLNDTLLVLSKIKDKKTTFYFLKSKDCIYVYSHFFNWQDSIDMIMRSFENYNVPLLLCEMKKNKIIFSVYVKGIAKQHYIIETADNLNEDVDPCLSISDFPQKRAKQIISFIGSNYKLSNCEINKYLNSHSIFKDEYII